MLGFVLRILRGIEVNDETLSIELIEEVVKGPGHFLGSEQTLSLMDSEYIYPELGDRLQTSLWEELGGQDIRQRAKANVEQILSTHYPTYIDPAVDAKIRDAYQIALEPDAMKPGNDRW
jgi:trimethylamine--corrinoid protein Co-methyltransferase